jgi:hypothetical protein
MTMMRSTDLCLACRLFIVSRDWFEEYDLQKFYLKVKSVGRVIFILAQLLINFNGSLLKMRLKE